MGKFQNRSGQEDTTVWQVYTGAVVFILGGLFFVTIGIYTMLYQWFSILVLLFTIIPLWHISIGVWSFLQVRVYKNLEKYFDVKEIILEKDTLLRKLIEKDKENIQIDPMVVMEFVDILSKISTAYKYIFNPLSVAINWRTYFKIDAQEKLSEFVGLEKIWLLQYTLVYRERIVIWLSNHKKELEETKKSIGSVSYEIRDWITTLNAASTRLDNHINSIHQISSIV